GQAFRTQARLITTFELVPAGTDGGITPWGTLCGTVAAFVVGLVCVVAGLLSWKGMLIASVAGTLGMFADSYLGALLERRAWIGNDAVNFLSTTVAALVAISCAAWLH
ncbi:MAG: TIGR00297 family protein, partial [Acidobacteria bacterium]